MDTSQAETPETNEKGAHEKVKSLKIEEVKGREILDPEEIQP